MKRIILFLSFVALFFESRAQLSTNIRLNQVGFYTKGPKMAAIIGSTATSFTIKSVDRNITYYNGSLSVANTWSLSGESVKIADFTDFVAAGDYVLDVPSLGYSYTFKIQDKALVPLNKALIKAYYFNRSSTALDAKYAGKWARPLGHPDDKVIVLPSAASTLRPAGTVLPSPKGWYDAGDYNSYIVNSGISTYSLLMSYEHFSNYYDTLNLNIPESSNSLPDILDEIKWNLDWMLTMQDPNDGGVYTKKTNAAFDDFVMPDEATTARYFCKKSTAAAGDFAAVLAMAYRIYKNFDPAFATNCLNAAKSAYQWAQANPSITFSNPGASGIYPAVGTGGYGDGNLTDELEWAGNELYVATGDEMYYGFKSANTYSIPDWANVRTLGLFSLIYNRKKLTSKALADTTAMKNKLSTLANTFSIYQKNTSPYKVVMGSGGNGDFVWGSNAQAANQAMILLNAYLMTQNIDYANAAVSQVDYLAGRNATGYSFVTGIGSKPVMNIHHRPSGADGILDPVPGWLSGGPSGSSGDGCANNTTLLAKSFTDAEACYTKNEIAINWNAPAVYITGALEFLGVYNVVNAIDGDHSLAENNLVVFPVPTQNEVHIQLDTKTSSYLNVKILNNLGVEMGNKTLQKTENGLFKLSLVDFNDGVFVLEIDVQGKIYKRKVVVNK